MKIQTQVNYTLSFTQDEVEELTAFLDVLAFRDDVEWNCTVGDLHTKLNQELNAKSYYKLTMCRKSNWHNTSPKAPQRVLR